VDESADAYEFALEASREQASTGTRRVALAFGIWHLAFGMDRQNASWVDRAD